MRSVLRKKVLGLLLIFPFILSGCTGISKNSNDVVTDSDVKRAKVSTHFAIVLVKGVKTGDAIKSKIEDLQLETEPVLTDRDLISYKWKDHELELRQGFDLYKLLGRVPTDGLPFVVIADDKRVYLGAFWTSISSVSASIPVILDPKKVIKIYEGYPGKLTNDQLDPRSDKRIYNALKSIGKIKE